MSALEVKARREIAHLERGLVILEIIVGIAPLLGLVGTIQGIIPLLGDFGKKYSSRQRFYCSRYVYCPLQNRAGAPRRYAHFSRLEFL